MQCPPATQDPQSVLSGEHREAEEEEEEEETYADHWEQEGEELSRDRLHLSDLMGVLQLRPMFGRYVWLVHERFLVPPSQRFCFYFEAQTKNDIHVCFNRELSETEGRDGLAERAADYEIVLGGWMNTRTAVRKQGQQQAVSRERIDRPDAFLPYWIAFDSDFLVVGKGRPGTTEILRWKHVSTTGQKEARSPLRYVGLSSWDADIQFRSLEMSPVIPDLSPTVAIPGLFSSFALLFNDKLLSDVVFELNDGTRMYAHRCILACRSSKFAELFEQPSVRGNQVISLPDVEPVVFKMALQFIYTSKLPNQLSEAELRGLFHFSQEWDLTFLKACCEANLFNTAAPQDVYWWDFSRLFDTGLYSDVTLVIEDETGSFQVKTPLSSLQQPPDGQSSAISSPNQKQYRKQTIRSHRAILVAFSDHFAAMFLRSFRERSQHDITLHDVPYEATMLMLKSLYTLKPLPFESVQDEALAVLLLVDRFSVNAVQLRPLSSECNVKESLTLEKHCCKFAEDNLNIENCCEVLSVTNWLASNNPSSIALQRCRTEAMRFIEHNFYPVSQTQAFSSLGAPLLLEIILKDSVRVEKEEHVFEAVIHWSNAHLKGLSPTSLASMRTKENVEELLTYVRYPLMKKDYLREHVLANDLVSRCSALKEIVLEAIALQKKAPSLKELRASTTEQAANKRVSRPLSRSHPEQTGLLQIVNGKVQLISAAPFQIRSKRRLSLAVEEWKELPFLGRPEGGLGVCHFIGTNYGQDIWRNPHRAKRLTVLCSSPSSRYTQPQAIVDKSYHTTSYMTGKPPWVVIALRSDPSAGTPLQKHLLIPTHYAIRHDNSHFYLRHWKFQGSADDEMAERNWVDLSVHESDASITVPGQWASWPIKTASAYTYFRLVMTGPPAGTEKDSMLCLSNLELYGYFK